MKNRLFPLVCALVACMGNLSAAEPSPPTPVQADLRSLQQRILVRMKAGHKTAEALASELAGFDALISKYAGQPEAQARIVLHRAGFTSAILQDEATARALYETVVRDYPGTPSVELAKKALHAMTPERKAEIAALQAAWRAAEKTKRDGLVGKPASELTFTWSSRKGLRALADLRGKVVVLDFWATWCGPCIASFPQVRAEAEHFKDSPVVILGVTSLQGKVHGLGAMPIDVKDQPDKEYALTAEFAKKHEMTWPIAFSTQNVFNPDYGVSGIPSVVIIAPDGKVRHVGLNPLTPGIDIGGKITAILKEFNLPAPKVPAAL